MEFARVKQFVDDCFSLTKSKFNDEKLMTVTAFSYSHQLQVITIGLSNGKFIQFHKKGYDTKNLLSTKDYEIVKFFDVSGAHKGDIRCLCLEQLKGVYYVISGSADRTIKIWENDPKARAVVQTLVGHSGTIVALCYSQASDTLFSASNDRTLRIWKQEDGREFLYHPWYVVFQVIYDFSMRRNVGNQGYLTSFLLKESETLSLFIGDTEGSLHILHQEETWKQNSQFIIEKSFFNFHRIHIIQIINIDKDNTLYSIGFDQKILGFEEVAGKQFFSYKNPHKCLFTCIDWNSTYQELIASDEQGRIYFLNVSTDKQVQEYKLYDCRINKIKLIDSLQMILIITDNFIDVLRLKRGIKAGNFLDNHKGSVVGLIGVEAPASIKMREPAKLVSASLDNTIRIWQPNDMSCTMVLDNTLSFEISSLHFLVNANLLVTGHENGDVVMWNIELGSSLLVEQNPKMRHTNMICCMASKVFKGNDNEVNEFMFSAGYDGKLNVWEIFEKGKQGSFGSSIICPQLKQSVPCNKNEQLDSIGNELLCMLFDSNTNCIVTAGNKGDIYFIEMFTFEKRIVFKGHKDSVNCLAMDTRILFSGSDDKTIRLWDTLSCQYLTLIEAHETGIRQILVIEESGHLISCANGVINVWNYPKKQLIKSFIKPESLKCMCYVQEEKSLFIGTEENNIYNYPMTDMLVQVDQQSLVKNKLLQQNQSDEYNRSKEGLSQLPLINLKGNKNVFIVNEDGIEEQKEIDKKGTIKKLVQFEVKFADLQSNDYLKQMEDKNKRVLQEFMKNA